MKKCFLPLVFVASALAFVSCNQKSDNSAQVKDLEDRIRQLEDQEKQLQLKSEQDKLATDRAALEAEKERLREQQNAINQSTPVKSSDATSRVPSSGTATTPADYQEADVNNAQGIDADSYNLFYERLEPEGHWFEDPNYGYVWQPGVAEHSENCRRYTDG